MTYKTTQFEYHFKLSHTKFRNWLQLGSCGGYIHYVIYLLH